jgi:beta-N-acetylhexosaminidase
MRSTTSTPNTGAASAAAAPKAPASAAALAGVRFLRSFDGLEPSDQILAAIRDGRTSGVTLFRARNVSTPEQVRDLCAALQAARPAGAPPLVIGLDQEGGQLQAVGDGATAWPGNLAVGATGSEELARRAGRAIGAEVAAVGGTLVYAPVCDVLQRSSATPLGTRPFGEDPGIVARMAAAMTAGLQESGIAATLKHFPGHGSAAADSHKALPVVSHDLAELREFELPPFVAGIAAGARAVLPGHLAVPALTGGAAIPATISRAILVDLLRDELGFRGVTISDALDMAGASHDGGLGGTVGAAADAGMDLLLLNHPADLEEAAFEALRDAIESGAAGRQRAEVARDRIMALRTELAGIVQPPIGVVGCAEHRALAREIAEASMTLVRDPEALLPLVATGARIAVLAPTPVDLTPAETSSYLRIGLAEALRERGLEVDAFTTPLDPTASDVAAIAAAVAGYAMAIVCTFDAVSFPGQVSLVSHLAGYGTSAGTGPAGAGRVVAVACRSPYDVALFPAAVASICTYGIQPPQIDALADALLGRIPFAGCLPVRLEPAR